MKKSILILLLLALAGAALWSTGQDSQVVTYRTVPVVKGSITAKVSATGTLQAVTKIEVGSQVSGIITEVYVHHNSIVKQGQVLAQLDPSTYQTAITQASASVSNADSSLANAQADAANAAANVRAAEAAVVSAQAAVKQAQVGIISAEASIVSARARVRKAESARDNARKSYQRSLELQHRDLIAQAELDTESTSLEGAEADLESARADLSSAHAGLESAEVNVAAKQTDVQSARIKKQASQELVTAAQARTRGFQAQVAQARANLRTAEINLERTTITSPIDGVVLDIAITAGQTVAAQLQAPNLFTLAQDLGQMQVETSVDEADIAKVKKGALATFSVDAFPGSGFQGAVTEVRQSPVASNGVVTYVVIIATKNSEGLLKPGMTATVEIVEQERKDVLKIPNEALEFRPQGRGSSPAAEATQKNQGSLVYTLEQGQLAPHQVKVGLSDGSESEILSGDLENGQPVVVRAEGVSRPPRQATPARPGGGPPGMF